MSRAPAARRVAASLVALVCLLAALAVASRPATAAGEHHAAVIIETGEPGGTHRVVISFSEDSISGIEALQRAGANPIAAGFSGLGAGVCELYGVGHPATVNECLGVPGDARFWAYWHVPAGQSGFDDSTWSRAGASSVQVHDGDTEGWRFATGEPPTFVQLPFPEPPAAAAPPAASGTPAPAPDTGGAPSDAGGPPTGPAAAGAGGPTTSTTLVAPPGGSVARGAANRASTTSTTRSRSEVEASRASATSRADGDDNGGTVLSLAGFAAVLAVLAAGIYLARRARVGSRASGP